VERLCHVHGDPVYVIVRDMQDYADRRDDPGKNFRAFVLKRIAEHGFEVGKAEKPESPQERSDREGLERLKQNLAGKFGRMEL